MAEGEELSTKVAWFLVDIGEYDTANQLLSNIISKLSKKYGMDAVELADPLHATMTLLMHKGVYGVSLAETSLLWISVLSTELKKKSNLRHVPVGSPSRGGDVAVYVLDINQASLPTPFYSVLFLLFYYCVYFCLYASFNCISFHEISRQFSTFSLCTSRLIGPFNYISIHDSISSPDIMRSG